MPRITLQNVLDSDLPESIGKCATDTAGVAKICNQAQSRLIESAGETGFNGGWERVVFEVDRTDPYITLPPEITRVVNADICRFPVNVRNEWYEFLIGSYGLMKPDCASNNLGRCNPSEFTDRGYYPTAYDIPSGDNSLMRIYFADARDVGVAIFFSGAKDQNGLGIYTDGNGFSLTTASPFATTTFVVTSFDGIQKPVTYGDIVLKAVDEDTGEETLLARFTPNETNPSYRRYLLTGLPLKCCEAQDVCTIQVTCMAKLQHVPVVRTTDFFIIQSIPALKAMCQAIRYENMDTGEGAALAVKREADAIRILNKQLAAEQGVQNPSITVTPFGTATLARQRIGSVV